jgi:UDP-N-acetylglucosamine 3-dehydrogenase
MTTNRYRYAIIGTGRPHGSEDATGFGMAHPHYKGFKASDRTDLVAIADIDEDHARAFLADYNLEPDKDAKIYLDYKEMLRAEKPDIVSVTTWPHLHAEMVVAACEAGVRAVHCEKPMATTWADAKRMKAAADASGTILTFNHQRRFLEPFQKAVQIIRGDELGELQRIEAQCGDMYDWGTHWLDMMQFLNNETPIEWVIGQIDSRQDNVVFGAPMENQAICHYKWTNGVRGLMVAGYEAKWDCAIRVTGTKGTLEVLWNQPCLRIRTDTDTGWRVVETKEGLHNDVAINRACADLVRALDEPGHTPLLTAASAIKHTEAIFATYYSSLYRGRVDLPLTYEGNALHDMLASGDIGPQRKAE